MSQCLSPSISLSLSHASLFISCSLALLPPYISLSLSLSALYISRSPPSIYISRSLYHFVNKWEIFSFPVSTVPKFNANLYCNLPSIFYGILRDAVRFAVNCGTFSTANAEQWIASFHTARAEACVSYKTRFPIDLRVLSIIHVYGGLQNC